MTAATISIMRKLILFLFLLVSVIAEGRKIPESEAAAVASRFLNSTPTQQQAKSGVRLVRKHDAVKDETVPYYVYNADSNNGFVIISGDDRARCILGYSDKGSFDFNNLPPQLADILNRYVEQLKAMPDDAPAHSSWGAKAQAKSSGEGVLLETANWGQGAPYNSLCPVIDGERALTGCVATAMAIVMKYHNWPAEYDWDAMPMTKPDSPIESLSKLMADAGEAVFMKYGTDASCAYMGFVGRRLQQKFKYSPDFQYIRSANLLNEEWTSMLKGNLDNNEPVIYSGTSESVSHAFIIDGYKDDDFHVNWGWDGACNGYFALDALNLVPNALGYSSNANMVINIAPDKSGKEYSTAFCDFEFTGHPEAPGPHFSVDSPKQNQVFDYSCSTISYPYDESGQIGLLLYDKNGNVKEVINTQTYTEGRDYSGMGYAYFEILFHNISILSDVQLDDYITLATRKTASHPWLEMLSNIEAPLKQTVAEIKKDVGLIQIINKVPNTKIRYPQNGNWVYADYNENISVESVKRDGITIFVENEDGHTSKNVTITVVGKGTNGDIQTSVDGSITFYVYGDSYTVTIEEAKDGIEKNINLTDAGKLSEVLSDTQGLDIGSLTIMGSINAADIWFIRDNLKSLKSLDISEATVVACDADDPIYPRGEPHLENSLPKDALTGLIQLNTLKLPKGLKCIEGNALMNLAITSIEIPSKVQSIEVGVFSGCMNLQTVVCRMSQPPFIDKYAFEHTKCPASGVLYVPTGASEAYRNAALWQDFAQIIEDENPKEDNEIVSYEGLKYRILGKALYLIGYEQSQLADDVVIPDVIRMNGNEYTVLGIDDKAMQNAEINSFTMPNSITTIGEHLFTGSTVKKVRMSDNIKFLPDDCIIGYWIEELNIPKNAELIRSYSILCPALKKLHLPKNLHSDFGCEGRIGFDFRNLEEITVDPENEEWSVQDGILYWKGLSHLVLVPNTMSGELVIPDEVTRIYGIENCNKITKITFGNGVKSVWSSTIGHCENLKHIDFNNNVVFINGPVIYRLDNLESFTVRDFVRPNENCFSHLPSLKYVYLLNTNPVDFSGAFYDKYCNPQHDYYSPSLNPQATVPENNRIFVPGGAKANINNMSSSEKLEEMWEYEIDRTNSAIKVKPLIDGLVIDGVTINDVACTANPQGIYIYNSTNDSNLDVVVDFTLHERQAMTTHYDAEFNALIPDSDLSDASGIDNISGDVTKKYDVYNSQGVMLREGCNVEDLKGLSSGVYVIKQGSSVRKIIIR